MSGDVSRGPCQCQGRTMSNGGHAHTQRQPPSRAPMAFASTSSVVALAITSKPHKGPAVGRSGHMRGKIHGPCHGLRCARRGPIPPQKEGVHECACGLSMRSASMPHGVCDAPRPAVAHSRVICNCCAVSHLDGEFRPTPHSSVGGRMAARGAAMQHWACWPCSAQSRRTPHGVPGLRCAAFLGHLLC